MATEQTSKIDPVEGQDTARVLVFTVDDGFFGVHLDWAEAVYQRDAVAIHSVRTRSGGAQAFLAHRGEPAFVIDLREVLDLGEILGTTERSAFVIIRSGSYRLAVSIDELVGVEPLELGAHVPVASSLLRDGGLCVGHLVERDEGILVVLDPNRLLDGGRRDALEPALRVARGYIDRQRRIEELWAAIRKTPSVVDVRNYARLCRRGGRSKAANATRTVLKYLEPGDGAAAESTTERLIRELLRCAAEQRTGDVIFRLPDGGTGGKIILQGGCVADAEQQGEWGVVAFRRLLEMADGDFRFEERERSEYPARIAESTVALLIASLESISEERRGRRDR